MGVRALGPVSAHGAGEESRKSPLEGALLVNSGFRGVYRRTTSASSFA